jgi:hypothetical protein
MSRAGEGEAGYVLMAQVLAPAGDAVFARANIDWLGDPWCSRIKWLWWIQSVMPHFCGFVIPQFRGLLIVRPFVGLVTLPIFASIIWLTISGWRDFYWVGRASSRKVIQFIWFLPLAAIIGGVVFIFSLLLFIGSSQSVYSFGLYLAIANIGALWILSALASMTRERRSVFSNACRVGAAFYIFYYSGFAEPLARSLGVKFTSV